MSADSLESINPAWLTSVLRSAGALGDGRVVAIEASELGRNAGLMSQVLRLAVRYDSDEAGSPSSLIVKVPPTSADSRRAGVNLGFFEGECGFYRDLAAKSAIPTPRCFFTHYDADSGGFLTLLQDLSSMRLGDIETGCSREEATDAVEILARFHASWWNSDALADLVWLRRRGSRLAEFAELLPTAWPTFATRFKHAFDPDEFAILREVEGILRNSLETLLVGPQTLLHGDFKLDNLFFAPSGEIVVADWGLVMSGPPMFDLATFLGINLPRSERQATEAELIKDYVRYLTECGVRSYDSDEAFRDYKLQLVGLLPQFIGAGGLATFVDQQAIDDFGASIRRVLGAVQEHDTLNELPR